jgi:hypothetical protein
MRNLNYLFAAAAIGSLLILPQTSSASPLGAGLAKSGSVSPAITDGLVQKVHGWHCGKRKGWYHGKRYWHRHRRACHRAYYYDDDYYDDDYYYRPYYRPRYHYGYGFPFPFFGFHFGRGHRDWWDDD